MRTERTVSQVIDLARQWIQDTYGNRPDFVGAHLVGSLHHMPLDAPFAAYRDVDLAILLDSISEQKIDDALYEGLILEAIVVPASRYESAEQLLGDACNASILAGKHSILLDPKGKLAPLAKQVNAEYPRRQWVTARRDDMLKEVRKAFNDLSKAQDVQQAAMALGTLNMYLIAVLTTVHLTPLTHRRNMLQLRGLIASDEEQALFEKLHQLLGSASITPEEAEVLLDRATRAFDTAVPIHKTPVPYDHKLDACIRPYLVEGTQEMFAEDGYRESFFWMALFLMISCASIAADGDEAAKAEFLPYAGELLQTMGLDSPEHLKERILFAGKLTEEVVALSNKIIETNPDILS